jgi:hypothetical protein
MKAVSRMDDIEEYIKDRDAHLKSHYIHLGRVQQMINDLRLRTSAYMKTLSTDAVARPEFIREFNLEMNEIISKLEQ